MGQFKPASFFARSFLILSLLFALPVFAESQGFRPRRSPLRPQGVGYSQTPVSVNRPAEAPAPFRTTNFLVIAGSAEMAKRLAWRAEELRAKIAGDWLGRRLADLNVPMVVKVQIGELQSDGFTNVTEHNGNLRDWQIFVQGTEAAVWGSVLPHEIFHTVMRSHFGVRLPICIEEGLAMSSERQLEARMQLPALFEILNSSRRLPLGQLIAVQSYPRDIEPVYIQGYWLTQFLLRRGGKEKFMNFLHEGIRTGEWEVAIVDHFSAESIDHLEDLWLKDMNRL